MKTIPFAAFILSLFFIFIAYGCNSKGYEIEEVEDYTDSSRISAKTDIKREIEQPQTEIKEETSKTPKTVIRAYTIQIGAFLNESNVIAFTKKAKDELPYNINYILMQGLYKVRFGNYDNKNEAFSILSKVIDAGYDDAFIIEIRR
jgi:septal ring-binding cell division protein DamX